MHGVVGLDVRVASKCSLISRRQAVARIADRPASQQTISIVGEVTKLVT